MQDFRANANKYKIVIVVLLNQWRFSIVAFGLNIFIL